MKYILEDLNIAHSKYDSINDFYLNTMKIIN